MVKITVSEHTYRRLQAYAIPFEDTHDTALARVFNELDECKQLLLHNEKDSSNSIRTDIGSNVEFRGNQKDAETVRLLDPDNPGDLKFTKVRKVYIDGKEVTPNWSSILKQAHILAKEKNMAVRDLIRISLANLKEGNLNGVGGFDYIPELGISIQGVDANYAWKYTLHLMKHLKLSVEIDFKWRDKEGAQFPGEFGELIWQPRE